jgi:hypothetical protein
MLSSNDRRFPALLCRTAFDLKAQDSGIRPVAAFFLGGRGLGGSGTPGEDGWAT